MKEQVIAILAAHDGLRAHQRAEFIQYLNVVFAQAERVPLLESTLADQHAEIESLKAGVAALKAAAIPSAQ